MLPRTLRDMEGLPGAPPALSEAALVLIDCQNTYREGVMKLVGVEPALVEAAGLLRRARAAGTRIFHVRHDSGPGSAYDVAAPIGQISDEVAPAGDEAVVTKQYPNAFIQTDLEARLRAAGVTHIILAGFMTHMCINSTARAAFSLGFAPTVVASATATRDLPGLDGQAIPAATLQASSLAGLHDLFAVVVRTQTDIPG